jgi:hypothetical protein
MRFAPLILTEHPCLAEEKESPQTLYFPSSIEFPSKSGREAQVVGSVAQLAHN